MAIDAVRRETPADPAQSRPPLVLTRRVASSIIVERVGPEAQALGLRPGLTLGEARAVVPSLIAIEHDPRRDVATLERLAGWALRFSPIVEPVEPNTLLLDITGCERLFGGEQPIARQARDGLRAQGFHARAAIADTVGAACALASTGTEPLTIAPQGLTREYLAPLPPVALRIDDHVARRLHELGIHTIGDLLTLPRSALPARFGSPLVRRLQQALGEIYEDVSGHTCEQPPAARISFETPLADLPTLQAVVGRLLAELFDKVTQAVLALRRLDCVLVFERATPTVLEIGLSRSSRAWRHVEQLVRRRLEAVDLSAGVLGVRLVAAETARWQPGQIDLFEPRDPGDEEDLGCLLDRLVNRLGADAVVRTELVDDHQPEAAFRYVRAAGKEKSPKTRQREKRKTTSESTNRRSLQPEEPQACRRPVRLFQRPPRIRVIALVPDGPPTWLAVHGREQLVARAWGPERIETAWWRGPDIRRDYFRVALETGEQLWVYRDATDGQWYLHGLFA